MAPLKVDSVNYIDHDNVSINKIMMMRMMMSLVTIIVDRQGWISPPVVRCFPTGQHLEQTWPRSLFSLLFTNQSLELHLFPPFRFPRIIPSSIKCLINAINKQSISPPRSFTSSPSFHFVGDHQNAKQNTWFGLLSKGEKMTKRF